MRIKMRMMRRGRRWMRMRMKKWGRMGRTIPSRQGQGGGGETGSMSMSMIREDNVKEIDKPKARGPKSLNFPDGKFQCAKTFQTK